MLGTGTPLFPAWFHRLVEGGGGSTLLNDLVSYWTLDEQSGTREDSVGDADLTDNNTVGCSLYGPSGTVAQFVATSSESLTGPSLNLSTAGTLAVWFNADALTNYMLIIGTSNGSSRGMEIYADASNNIHGVQHSTGGEFGADVSGGPLSVGAWYFAVVTYDQAGDNRVHLYINGAHVAQSNEVTGTPGVSAPIGIGNWSYGASTAKQGCGGIWSRGLSSDDVLALMNAGTTKSYADLTAAEKVGLVSYWNLDEASGQRNDSHGTNHLTDNNTVGSATATPGAMHNIAASFVEANSESLSYDGAVADVTEDFTVAVWARASAASGGMRLWGFGNYGDQVGLMVETENSGYHRLYNWYGGGTTSIEIGNNIGNWVLYGYEYTVATNKSRIVAFGSATNSGVWSADLTYVIPVPAILWFGYRQGGGWTGQIDEAAIWNRHLTDDEWTELWDAGAGKFYPFES